MSISSINRDSDHLFCRVPQNKWSLSLFMPIAVILCVLPLISHYRQGSRPVKGIPQNDIIYNVFGEARRVFSLSCYVNADVYYHGGIYKIDKSEWAHIHAREHEHGHGEEHAHGQKHKKTGYSGLLPFSAWNILPYMGERIYIGRHMHLEGEELKEVLPWLTFATELDPHNVRAYVLGGWTAWRRLGRLDEAEEFLKEGLRRNPASWEIHKALGHLYFGGRKDVKSALPHLREAEELALKEGADRYRMREIYTFTAYCYEELGAREKVLGYYESMRLLFPKDETISNKIDLLK